jgi:uncharacterized membrane protein YgdD (TMEM256/DUF423 family)
MDRTFLILGALVGFLGVAIGAFGAHALEETLKANQREATFATATQYHMYHALALLAVAWAATRWPDNLTYWAGYLFIIGIILFSGSLYALSLTNQRWLGAVTPFGGLAFLAGWFCLGLAAWRGTAP